MANDGTSDLPQWFRTLELGSDPPTLERREAGVEALLNALSQHDVEALVRLALKAKQPAANDAFLRIRQAFKSADETFPSQGNDRELQILCAAALAALFRRAGDVAATAALAVSTAAAVGARRPDLPLDLAEAAEAAIDAQAETRRRRPDLTKLPAVEFPKGEFDKAVAKAQGQQDFPGMIAALGFVTDASKAAYAAATKQCTDGLAAANAFIAIQDEELQMLWWLTGERSWDLDRPFTEVPRHERVLVLAKELADLTLYLPGPPALKSLLARGGVKEQDEVTIATCVNACDADWLKGLVDATDPSPITRPVHFAIKRKLETGDETAWIAGWSAATGLDANGRHPALQVGLLFYRERLLARS